VYIDHTPDGIEWTALEWVELDSIDIDKEFYRNKRIDDILNK